MSVPALNEASPLALMSDLLGSQSDSIKFTAGTRIFDQDAPGDCAYMIDSGHVEISTFSEGKKESLATLGPGEIFGEMALLDGRPRSATATAIHEATVIAISRQQLLDEVNRSSPIARLLLISSINRLRSSQEDRLSLHGSNATGNTPDAVADKRFQTTRHDAAEQVKFRFALDHAITARQFDLHYQPVVSLADGRTAGFEALLRWPRPGKQFISPADFVPIMEHTGLIVPLGVWVLETALKSLRLAVRKHPEREIFMSVNVSPRQLNNEENVERLATTIERADIDPQSVKLEITEEALLDDPRMAAIGLGRLTQTGASIAIDDFGTGYSSLNYLHRFPLSTLKIDRSFVAHITGNHGRQRVVAAILGLSNELGMDVVAEGIEEKDELLWLQAHGCRYGQGYLLAKPTTLTNAMTALTKDFEW